MTPDGYCSYKHTLFCDSRWLLMAPDDSHRVSLPLNPYPEVMTALPDRDFEAMMDDEDAEKDRNFLCEILMIVFPIECLVHTLWVLCCKTHLVPKPVMTGGPGELGVALKANE